MLSFSIDNPYGSETAFSQTRGGDRNTRRHRVKGKSGQTGGTVSTAASNSFFVSLKSEKPFHIIFAFIPIIVTKLG